MAQSEQKTLAVSIREGVASACERAESVKKQLAARIDAEETKLKDGLAAAREDAAELRTELSSASTAQIKLAARPRTCALVVRRRRRSWRRR